MAHILIMPRQGNTVESCVLVDWKVKEGDTVTEETIVCNVETDKAAFEVPAGSNGILLKILCEEGDDIPVLDPIAVIGAVGENWEDVLGKISREISHGGTETQSLSNERTENREQLTVNNEQRTENREQLTKNKEQRTENEQHSPLPTPHSPLAIFISPRAKNLLEKEAFAMSDIGAGTGPGGRIIERDVIEILQNKPALTVAAKAARPETIPSAGTGISGRITSEDLKSSLSTPIKGIRKIIADRMLKSLSETAQFTLNASAPVSRLQDLRTRMNNENNSQKISINDMILFAVSRVLLNYPYMNAHKIGDTVMTFENVHLGFAVDTTRGLMVPVIRNANQLSLAQISAEVKRLAKACQEGNIKPDDLSGSTFTVTNLGSLGITSFTPILNIPEVAILGVCNIELKPVADSPLPCSFAPHIGFSLTINHQVVDGAPAARFLKALGEAIANIDMELLCTTQ